MKTCDVCKKQSYSGMVEDVVSADVQIGILNVKSESVEYGHSFDLCGDCIQRIEERLIVMLKEDFSLKIPQ